MRYLEPMNRLLLALASLAAILLSGCADNLTPDQTDKPPAPATFASVRNHVPPLRDQYLAATYLIANSDLGSRG